MAGEMLVNNPRKAAATEAAAKAAEKKVADLRNQLDQMKAQAASHQMPQAILDDMARQIAEAEKAATAAKIAWQETEGVIDATPVAFTAPAASSTAGATSAGTRHVWTSEDTYASLAQKYYGSFQEPYWRLIYEHNMAIIGDHPNAIRVGLEIEIPPLPDALKKK
jgi:hypothetical protein